MVKRYQLNSYGKTDIGHVRTNNEDVFGARPEYQFYLLADGMGGYPGGEVAAYETVFYLCNAIEELFLSSDEAPATEILIPYLRKFIKASSAFVYRLGQKNPSLQGMGTTICAALFSGPTLIYAHVGDSRIYQLQNDQLTQITTDHSLYNKLVNEGQLSEAQARIAAPRNILSRAVGVSSSVEPDIEVLTVQPGDRYLLCSDGLSDYVSDEEIKNILKTPTSLETQANALIQVAKSYGGGDNITVLLIQVEGADVYSHLSR